MSCNSSSIYSDGFSVGEIVWARHNYDGMYWPGRITSIPNHLQYQSWSYVVQFFGYNQTNWTMDILPYKQYRDYMSKNLLIHYDTYPQIKYHFLNAIHQADANENSNHNDKYISTSNPITTNSRHSIPYTNNEYPLNSYHQYASNCSYNTQFSLQNYCPCCTQTSIPSASNQLSIETNLNSQVNTFEKIHSVIILTTKTYANSSFISFIFNSLSNFFHSSIIYIDHLTNYQHPTTSTISYLICFDHFDLTIKQTLNSTILNNLNAHINYLFLIINTPSQELITHFYSTIMNKRSILVLHYHYSTFDNEPLLLCSGNRKTYEMIRLSFLKYLCSKIKYIESKEEQSSSSTDSVPFISQLDNIKSEPMIETVDQIFESELLTNDQNNTNESFPISSVVKHTEKLIERKHNNNHKKKIFKRRFKQKKISTSSEYSVQNILDNYSSS
ncbi:unnamed protein product [Adineta steineri]|uniref:PWWP domain-containing protein n=1 Tax=Adineta steineri TaxID=433720 RepID=A0A815CQI6_9BILA|nr:unnamed protein product [Adineta steineri]CAF1359787.1 unnamed protein product [Adineta steineri]CAF3702226.1 unnamed protein product [Adineta steineri]CAF3760858.1 unnamed protein product [Adineta steineri]